ncbi:hypothetical protein MKX01_004500 [Papaver californicum]|nr:hypothetical protein MKX01_026040 [Papaver californicum]KAI3983938.1 hypothetical protein MKX01_004500 [Papaver californicum]
MAQKVQQQLREVGSKLETPPTAKDALIELLEQAAVFLSELDQSPSALVLDSMQPCLNAMVKPELLKQQDGDVKLLVATCLCEITRITAPEAPYSDDILRDIFILIVGTFHGLSDTSGPSFGRRVVILETLAKYRSCVVMLDLECDDLVNEMFSTFFAVASDDHSESVLTSMQTIMVLLLDESEEIPENLLIILLSVLGRGNSDVSMAARRVGMKVIELCAVKLEPCIKQLLVPLMSGDETSSNSNFDYHEVIYDIYRCAPQILSGIIPHLTGELLTDQLAIRLKAVKLLGDLFALPDYSISEAFQPLFSEFLKRLTDKVVEVRVAVVEHLKSCLLSNPSRPEADQIISALSDRLLDYDESVRKQVVTALCDLACHNLISIPVESAKLVAERLRDKSLLVKKYTMDRLVEIYRLYCFKCSDGSMNCNEYDWIPAKIVRCSYDKDFRSETIEMVLCESLFPGHFSIRDKVKIWVKIFSGFDKFEVKALEKIMEQKQRLQQEMQKYLSLRQMYQDGDATELEKKTSPLFRYMSRGFIDPAKAEEGFKVLDQLQDANMWKTLMNLTDPNTTFQQSCMRRDDLLRILGEEHKLHDFLSALSVKCSFLLFNKEYVKEIISEATTQLSAGDAQLTRSCIDLLVMVARFFPSLLSGTEEDLVNLLKEDNEIIKEGILHVLAKAGGSIREQLALTSSSVDLILERLCLEGSRRQAKYAVQALAAIAKDDGLMSLSVLYKRLVDMLEEKTHLPAILQSLGCIAQSAMPVFETREKEVVGFITSKILECSSAADAVNGSLWDERSELHSLKIYGIKTLVKSYLPEKDAHLRLGFDNLLEILKNVLTIGEICKDIKSSDVEKAHMKLASSKAVLRLSKHWDHKIPTDIFHLTIRTSEVMYPEAKGLFLGKVHQYIKDRLLDPKYACAFLFGISGCQLSEFKDNKHNLTEISQMCHQTRARQLPILCDASPLMTYPEYIVPYLVHALAHHSSCPNIDECLDVEAFETIYRQLHLFLSVVVYGDEDGKSEDTMKKKKESLSTLISIFESIKCSEDVLDVKKSINSHAICDLGVSIIKRLSLKQDALPESSKLVPLPAALYKPCEKKLEAEYLAKEGNTWLAGDSVSAHFESLKLEPDEMGTEINEDEIELDAIDKDGNEISLQKVMKSLKSKGTRTRKVVKKKVLTGETKKPDDGDDILGMVREINLDSMERSINVDSGNISGHFPSEEDNKQVNGGKIPDSGKRKREKVGQTTSVAASKRRIYSSGKGANKSLRSRSTPKGSRKALVDDSHDAGIHSLQYHTSDEEANSGSDDKMPDVKEKVKPKTSDLLSSCLPSRLSKGLPSKPKGNGTNKGLKKAADITGETDDIEMDHNSYELSGRSNPVSAANSSMNSDRSLKRNVTGLAKCSQKDANIQSSEMIGCRIKVWWPMDKKYYKGVIQSYSAKKKKHEILYDDGETEVLQLGRERWELISDGQYPRKRLKSSKSPPSKGMSAQKRKRTMGGSKLSIKSEKRSSSSRGRQKRVPKKSVKPKKSEPESNISGSDFSDAERKENSDIIPVPVTTSKFSDANSGDSEEKQTSKSHSDTEKSNKEEDSDSEENHSPDGYKSPIDEQGSDEEKTDSEDRSVEKTQKSSTEVEETGKEVKSDSEVDSVAHETHKSSTEAEESDKEDKSDSEMEEEVKETQKSTEAEEPDKQEESNSEGTAVKGSVKGPTDVNRFDEEKPELQSRMEEDRENNPTDAEDSAEEVKPESQDSMEEDTEKNPADAEKSDEEERPESLNGLDKDTEKGPTASGQSGEGEKSDSSKSDCASSGDSDNVPLSVWKRKAR